MLRYTLRRFLSLLVVVLLVATAVFFIIRMSGDPAMLLAPPDASEEQIQFIREKLGTDKNILVQYGKFLASSVQGDFGDSFRYDVPAMGLVMERLPATMQLAFLAILISLLVSIPLGVAAAIKRASALDQFAQTISLAGQSFPTFWIGLMLIIVFAEKLRWLPVSGAGGFQYLILPAITLSFQSTAMFTMLLRSSMLETLGKDYIRTARAKGVREKTVLLVHALRNAALPVISAISLQIGPMLAGAVVTETVFAYPGMGRLAVQSINNRDYAVVQAFVVLMALIIVTINFLADLLYRLVDPRVEIS